MCSTTALTITFFSESEAYWMLHKNRLHAFVTHSRPKGRWFDMAKFDALQFSVLCGWDTDFFILTDGLIKSGEMIFQEHKLQRKSDAVSVSQCHVRAYFKYGEIFLIHIFCNVQAQAEISKVFHKSQISCQQFTLVCLCSIDWSDA